MRARLLGPAAALWLWLPGLALAAVRQGVLRASGGAVTGRDEPGSDGEPAPACSCDCCITQQAPTAGAARGEGVACLPRAGPGVAAGAAGAGDGGCAQLCQVPDEDRGFFESRLGEVDYARYCLAACAPASARLNVLCMATELGGGAPGGGPAPAAAFSPALPPAFSPMLPLAEGPLPQLVARRAEAGADNGPGAAAALVLAKGEMEKARSQAQAAGQAARLARQSYEYIEASARAMAKAAAEQTLDEVRKAASEQAEEALKIRQRYEESAKENATEAALKAAKVYRKAKLRDMGIAQIWARRARQFDVAAREREDVAAEDAALAEGYKRGQAPAMERKYALKARQEMDEAEAYSQGAESARAQADKLMKGNAWYDWAEQAAAANALAKALPPGVAPPPVPKLP